MQEKPAPSVIRLRAAVHGERPAGKKRPRRNDYKRNDVGLAAGPIDDDEAFDQLLTGSTSPKRRRQDPTEVPIRHALEPSSCDGQPAADTTDVVATEPSSRDGQSAADTTAVVATEPSSRDGQRAADTTDVVATEPSSRDGQPAADTTVVVTTESSSCDSDSNPSYGVLPSADSSAEPLLALPEDWADRALVLLHSNFPDRLGSATVLDFDARQALSTGKVYLGRHMEKLVVVSTEEFCSASREISVYSANSWPTDNRKYGPFYDLCAAVAHVDGGRNSNDSVSVVMQPVQKCSSEDEAATLSVLFLLRVLRRQDPRCMGEMNNSSELLLHALNCDSFSIVVFAECKRRATRLQRRRQVALHCVCRQPYRNDEASADGCMVKCGSDMNRRSLQCRLWYHSGCCSVPPAVFKQTGVGWRCSYCRPPTLLQQGPSNAKMINTCTIDHVLSTIFVHSLQVGRCASYVCIARQRIVQMYIRITYIRISYIHTHTYVYTYIRISLNTHFIESRVRKPDGHNSWGIGGQKFSGQNEERPVHGCKERVRAMARRRFLAEGKLDGSNTKRFLS